MKTVILLTGCINPNGMTYTALNNIEERKTQYVNAIRFYLKQTNYPIVFSENSGTDISYLFQDYINSGRLECLSFYGNQEKERGKGFGECEIINNALNNSKILQGNNNIRIAKITGRLIINNIIGLIRLHQLFCSRKTTICMINSDLSFPDSRIILAHYDFFKALLDYKNEINDSKGFYFEHALCKCIKSIKEFPYIPFFIQPIISGMSGTTGEQYTENNFSCSFAIRYAKYAGSQLIRFNKLYRKN